MTASPLIRAIENRLRDAHYSDLATPLRIAGVEFAFTGAMRGCEGRALDLVLLFDTTTGEFGDREASSVRQRVESLSRALDVTGSRYVVTAILAGAVLAEGIEQLSETCRVLQVESLALNPQGEPMDDDALQQLEDQIRILLPLNLPDPIGDDEDGSGPAIEQLMRALPAGINKQLVEAVISASQRGEDAVSTALGVAVGAPFSASEGGDVA